MSTTPETRPADARAEPRAINGLGRVLVTTERPPRQGALASCLTFGWRRMLKIKHVPEQLLDVTITPILFLVMFTYLFGGAIAGSTREYLQDLAPAILVMSVLFTTVYSGVTLNTDVTTGAVDRFRSLPIWPPAPLVGALFGDTVRYTLAGAVTIAIALALGFRPDAPGGVLAAVALLLVFAFGLSWVFTTIGLLMRSPQAVMNAGFMGLFPLLFLSNAFVPDTSTMPGWLEAFVEVNPISFLNSAARGLMEGSVAGGDITVVLATAVVLTAVFAPLTTRLYRTRG